MEKGSFHTSESPGFDADEFVQAIALPNELPKGLEFSDIPKNMLNSSTVEGLISQNEDLMARLSVTLRKMAHLEETQQKMERENRQLKGRLETLTEQHLILQQKDRISGSRALQTFEENTDLKSKIERMEKAYADLFVKAQSFQKRMVQLERYRAAIRKLSPAMQARSKRLPAVEKELNEIRANFDARLVQTRMAFDARLNEARSEIMDLQEKNRDRNEVFAAKVEAENELVHLERKFETYRSESESENHRLFTEAAGLRSQLKDSLVIQASMKKSLEEMSNELPELENSNKALFEQVESLQALWGQKQKDLEQVEEKNRSLQKLNQSLGLTLNQQRKEFTARQTELENDCYAAESKIKTLQTEIELLRQELNLKD